MAGMECRLSLWEIVDWIFVLAILIYRLTNDFSFSKNIVGATRGHSGQSKDNWLRCEYIRSHFALKKTNI